MGGEVDEVMDEKRGFTLDFTGQTALVTGATRGIGKQVADDLYSLGAVVVGTGTDAAKVSELNDTLGDERRSFLAVDFTDEKSTDAFLEKIGRYEKIDVCINNAGINRVNPIDEVSTEDFDDIMNVNLRGPFLVLREVSRIMKKNGYGRVVNISSIFGVISKEGRSTYSATKFGLRGLAAAASVELARHGVLVNTVSPGFVVTDMTKEILGAAEMERLASDVPAGRLATADEISRVVIFIASSLNTYMAGQNIIVDGGYVNV